MAPAQLKFTYRTRKRLVSGWREYWFFRHPAYGSAKLPGQPGDAAFHARYSDLLAQAEKQPRAIPANSFEWLVKTFLASEEYRALRPRTQDDYSDTCDTLIEKLGALPYRLIAREVVKAVRDDFAATPRKAHKIKQMVSRLYSWADECGHVAEGYNPAKGIRRLKTRGDIIQPWTDDEVAAYLKGAQLFEAAPVMIGMYTGQRREDIATMLWSQWQGDIIRVRQSKTGVLIDVPCHPKLRAFLATLPRKAVTICYTGTGRATDAGRLSGIVSRRLKRAGVEGRSIHGLRYLFAGLLEEAGGTVEEAQSILGHHAWKMAAQYMAQRKRSRRAMAKMERA